MTVKVYQGERKFTKENTLLDEFEIKNISPKPKGQMIIEFKFSVDINGIIRVFVKESIEE